MNPILRSKIVTIKTIYSWILFIYMVFILTNFVTSFDVIGSYRFSLWDLLMTYGTIMLISVLEAGIVTLILFTCYSIIQYIFRFDAQYIICRLLIFSFFVSWINLLLTVIAKPLF